MRSSLVLVLACTAAVLGAPQRSSASTPNTLSLFWNDDDEGGCHHNHQPEDCNAFTDGCSWTSDWACPGSPSMGPQGYASNDCSLDFYCCCDQDGRVASNQPPFNVTSPGNHTETDHTETLGHVTVSCAAVQLENANETKLGEKLIECAEDDQWNVPDVSKLSAKKLFGRKTVLLSSSIQLPSGYQHGDTLRVKTSLDRRVTHIIEHNARPARPSFKRAVVNRKALAWRLMGSSNKSRGSDALVTLSAKPTRKLSRRRARPGRLAHLGQMVAHKRLLQVAEAAKKAVALNIVDDWATEIATEMGLWDAQESNSKLGLFDSFDAPSERSASPTGVRKSLASAM